jgi:hypothetical protein
LLKQLKVSTSQLDLLDSILSVVVALRTLREEQNLVEVRPPIVRPPQVGGYNRAEPRQFQCAPVVVSTSQLRKFKQPICWRYAEKGQCLRSCKKRHISKEALTVIPCPCFEKKGVCSFHEKGTCWYGHEVSVSAFPVNLVVESPDPPLSDPALFVDVGILPPQNSAIEVDFGTQTDPLLLAHSTAQTIPSETIDAAIQTSAAPPMANKMSQTSPQSLTDLLNIEYEVQKGWGYWFRDYGKKEKATEIFDERLKQLRELLEWLGAEE